MTPGAVWPSRDARAQVGCTGKTIGEQIDCGRHSGIPECCVYFFVTWWQDSCDDWRAHRSYDAFKGMAEAIHRVAWGYVVCPQCMLSGHYVRLSRCPEGCPRYRKPRAKRVRP